MQNAFSTNNPVLQATATATAISTNSFWVTNCPIIGYNGLYNTSVGSLILNGYLDCTNAGGSHLVFNDASMGVPNAWFLETTTNTGSADYYTPNNPGPDLYPFQPFNSVTALTAVGWMVYPVRIPTVFATGYFPNLQSNALYVDAQVGSDIFGQAGVYPFKSISVAIGSTNAPYPVFVSVGNFTEQNLYLRPMQALIGANTTPAAFNVGTGAAQSHFLPPVGGSTVLFYNTGGSGSMWVTATNLIQNVFFGDGAQLQPLFLAGTNLTMSGVTTMPYYSVNDFFQGNMWYNTTLLNCQIENAGTINVGEGENSGMTALYLNNLMEPWAFGTETYASGYVSYTGTFSNSLNLIVGGFVWLTNRSSAGVCLQAGSTNIGWELHLPVFRYSGSGALAITNPLGAPINGNMDDNGNITELGTNFFRGNGTGITNITASSINGLGNAAYGNTNTMSVAIASYPAGFGLTGFGSWATTNGSQAGFLTYGTNRLVFSSVSSLTNTLGRDAFAAVTAGTSVVLQDTNGNNIVTIGTIATLDVLVPLRVNMRLSGTAVSATLY